MTEIAKKSARIRVRRHTQNLRKRAIRLFGDRCMFCGVGGVLEFAHLTPNNIRGPGRGMRVRYFHILQCPKEYARMCPDHHKGYDAASEVDRQRMVKVMVDGEAPF